MKKELTTREVLLAAMFPHLSLALLNHFYKAPLYRAGAAWYWAADVLQFVLVPALAWFFLLRPAGIGPAQWGLALKPDRFAMRHSVGDGIFAALLIMAATWPAFRFTSVYLWQYADNYIAQQAIPPGYRVLVAIYMSVGAAFVEEVVFRALPWLYFAQLAPARWRRGTYILVSSLLFAAVHSEQGPGGVLAAFWFGLVAARMYSKRQNLWPLVLAHFLIDLIIFGF